MAMGQWVDVSGGQKQKYQSCANGYLGLECPRVSSEFFVDIWGSTFSEALS